MNGPDDSSPLDELLSAYLDGELDTGELAEAEALVATDPGAAERLAALREVSAAVSGPEPAPVPEDVRRSQIGRAVAASVVDLGAARRSRRPLVIGAAAALAVVFLAASLIALGSDDADDVESAGEVAADEVEVFGASDGGAAALEDADDPTPEGGGAAAPEEGPADGASGPGEGAASTTAAAEAGARSTAEELAIAAEELAADAGSEFTDTGEDASAALLDDECIATVEDAIGPVIAIARGTVGGREVVVAVSAERAAAVADGCLVEVVVDRAAE